MMRQPQCLPFGIAFLVYMACTTPSLSSEPTKPVRQQLQAREIDPDVSPFGLHAVQGAIGGANNLHAGIFRVIIRWEESKKDQYTAKIKPFDQLIRQAQQVGLRTVVTLRLHHDFGK